MLTPTLALLENLVSEVLEILLEAMVLRAKAFLIPLVLPDQVRSPRSACYMSGRMDSALMMENYDASMTLPTRPIFR